MSDRKELFSHCANILPVKDIVRSIEFYKDKLGFEVNFTWNDPVEYAVLKRGDVGIHLSQREGCSDEQPTRSAIYIFVYDVDAVYEEFLARKIELPSPPVDQVYRMREFEVRDPDGHMLTFGKGLD